MLKVLIVDDQSHVVDALELLLEMRGNLETIRASTPAAALEAVRRGSVGVVVHDMNFSESATSGQEGVELFRAIRALDPEMPVVLITAWASLQLAVDLVKQGADDYLQKPWNDEALLRKVKSLMAARQGAEQGAAGLAGANLCGLLFQSAAMRSVVSLAVKAAPSTLPVLVTGPNGAGKEKIAEIVQANSTRQKAPFIKVNVGALPNELFAAELFGAEAGAFTGARSRRAGRFEEADGGTLFLDEMGTLSLESQAKLLRALQSGEFERLGSNHTLKADVRVIAATNIDIRAAIARGEFREDLYYRLAVIEVEVPPLSARPEDIPMLAHALVEAYRTEVRAAAASPALSTDCLRRMQEHPWPGNVRELSNRLRRALLMADGAPIEAAHMGLPIASEPGGLAPSARASQPPPPAPREAAHASPEPAAPEGESSPLGDLSPLERAERETIEKALREADYVVSRAAAALGLSRQALYRRMQRLGLRLKRAVR